MAFVDFSTNNFQLTAFGNAQISTSEKKYGDGSAYFDGSGDYLQTIIPYSVWNMGVSNQPFTIEFWVYRLGSGTEVFIAKHGNVNAWNGSNGLNFNFYYTGTILYFEFWGGSSLQSITNTVNIPTGQWVHLAAAYDGTTTRIFVDGVLQGTTSTANYGTTTSANIFEIGSQISGGFPFNGYIDDLRITKGIARYTSNFTPPQQQLPAPSDPYADNVSLLLHMDGDSGSQTFTDSSSNNFTLSAFGNAQISTSVKKFGSGSGYFDGNGDYIELVSNNDFLLDGDFTIEMWVKCGPQSSFYPSLIGSMSPSWQVGGASIQAHHQTLHPNKFSLFLNGNDTAVLVSTSTSTDDAWKHLAITKSGNTWRMFVDGVLENTNTTRTDIVYLNTNGTRIGWDGWNGSNGYFNGYIDELRVTKGVARYTSNFVPHTAPFANPVISVPTNGLLAFWNLSDLSDSSGNGYTLTNNNNVQFVAGKIGDCAQFNGSNSLTVLNPDTTTVNTKSFSFWVKRTTSDTAQQGLICGLIAGWYIHTQNNKLGFWRGTGSNIESSATLPVDIWVHCVVIYNNPTLKFYINGVLDTNISLGSNSSIPEYTNICLGAARQGQLHFTGELDAVGIWQRELTQSEIDLLHNNGNGREP